MMKKHSNGVIGVLLLFGVLMNEEVSAQAMAMEGAGSIYLYRNDSGNEGDNYKRGYYVGPHELGDTVTMLMNAFEKEYTYYKSSTGAYATEEKFFIKKEIYKSVKDLVKSYEREFKKGKISKFTATVKVKAILTTGVKLVDYNTSLVENELKRLKSIKDKEKYLFDLKFGS